MSEKRVVVGDSRTSDETSKIGQGLAAANVSAKCSLSSATASVLNNVAPPSALPSFVPNISPPTGGDQLPVAVLPYRTAEFTAAIPSSKGIKYGMHSTGSIDIDVSSSTSVEEGQQSVLGFMEWVKGTIAGNGLLAKVAEKAKNSVDSMITTLDPQMKAYIHSGGDLEVNVASNREEIIGAIREAFQDVFGKATVEGQDVQDDGQDSTIVAQPVGFESGLKTARQRLQFENEKIQNRKRSSPAVVLVVVQNFLHKIEDDLWYELEVLLLSDPAHEISCTSFTQMTPVPLAIVAKAASRTADTDYASGGYSVTIRDLMAETFRDDGLLDRHLEMSGVSERDLVRLAGKALATNYKNQLISKMPK